MVAAMVYVLQLSLVAKTNEISYFGYTKQLKHFTLDAR